MFLAIIGDYMFHRFSYECGHKVYGFSRKTKFFPYHSVLGQLIVFNLACVLGMALILIYFYRILKKHVK